MDNTMLLFLLVLVIPVGGYFMWKSHKKKKTQGNGPSSGKKQKTENEAWATIKKYLRTHDETGKEIVELFVVKRPDPKDTTNLNKEQKKAHADNLKKQKALDKLAKKNDAKAYKNKKEIEKRVKQPELWMLYFTSRNAKTGVMDEPRLLEAEISYLKINKKQTDRVIKVNDKLDFKKEMEWVLPLKQKEDDQQLKNQKILEKKKQKSTQKKWFKKKSKEVVDDNQGKSTKPDNIKANDTPDHKKPKSKTAQKQAK